MATIDSIKVRMYRHGFGDCFLLQFMDGKKRISSMVIDCGLKNQSPSVDGARLKDVVGNIAAELTPDGEDNPELDTLVITHEHWDHVSGFNPNLFKDFKVDEVWMAWTEDPEDEVAQQINKRLKKNQIALQIVSEKINDSLNENPGFYKQFHGNNFFELRNSFSNSLGKILEFSNLEARAIVVTTDSGIEIKKFEVSPGTEKALNTVKAMADDGSTLRYFSPGKIIKSASKLPGLRLYVLGPPKTAAINKDLPSEGAAKETYFTLSDSSLDGFVQGVLHAHEATGMEPGTGAPFDDERIIEKNQRMPKKLIPPISKKMKAGAPLKMTGLILAGRLHFRWTMIPTIHLWCLLLNL